MISSMASALVPGLEALAAHMKAASGSFTPAHRTKVEMASSLTGPGGWRLIQALASSGLLSVHTRMSSPLAAARPPSAGRASRRAATSGKRSGGVFSG